MQIEIFNGRGAIKISGITPYPSQGNALFDIERALQKGHFRSFAEKDRGLDPQCSLVAHLLT